MKSILLSLLTCATLHASCLPDAPANLAAFQPVPPPGYAGIQVLRTVLVWSDVRTERGYTVERSVWTDAGWSPYALLAELPRNTTTWTDWQPAVCVYRVSAVNACGSAASLFVYQP